MIRPVFATGDRVAVAIYRRGRQHSSVVSQIRLKDGKLIRERLGTVIRVALRTSPFSDEQDVWIKLDGDRNEKLYSNVFHVGNFRKLTVLEALAEHA